MLKPEQVPDAVVKAFDEEYHFGEGDWKRNCLAAAINAWPGSYSLAENDSAEIRGVAAIILPLPQEVSDD